MKILLRGKYAGFILKDESKQRKIWYEKQIKMLHIIYDLN